MSAFDDEMRAIAVEILGGKDEIGFRGTISRPGTATFNSTTLRTEPGTAVTFTVLGAFTEPPDSRQYETQLSAEEFSERKWMVLIPTQPGEPRPGDILIAEGREIVLDGVNPIGPKRGAIYYRAYATR